MKVLHLISGLNSGGAEQTLYKLVTNDLNNVHIVISLKPGGELEKKLNIQKIKTYSLNFKSSIFSILQLYKLIRLILSIKPDLIQSWMYYCNFLTFFIKIFYRNKIYWNIRASFYKKLYPLFSKIIIYLSIPLSYFIPSRIIYCSDESLINHEKIYFSLKKSILIPNGFVPNKNINLIKNNNILLKYNLNSNNIIYAMIARFDPHKDHKKLIKCFEKFIKKNNNIILLIIGSNVNLKNNYLSKYIHSNQISKNILLLDHLDEFNEIYQIIDFHILLSLSESFPNVIAETMSMGIPNIASDVGHASKIIGNTGWIVNNDNDTELYYAINDSMKFYNDKKKFNELKLNCCNNISTNFHLNTMIDKYNEVWRSK